MKKRIALLVLTFLVLAVVFSWLTALPLGTGGCIGTIPQTAFAVTQTGEQTALVTHYGGENLSANQTFVTVGSTTRSWASLQSSAGDTVVTAGDNVTVSKSEDEWVRVRFQRPPPKRPLNPFEEPCYTTRNVTLDSFEN